VREILVLRDSTAPGVTGSTVFWPDKGQTYWFTSADPNGQIHVIRRSDGQMVGSFGRVGRGPGELENLHNVASTARQHLHRRGAGPARAAFPLQGRPACDRPIKSAVRMKRRQ